MRLFFGGGNKVSACLASKLSANSLLSAYPSPYNVTGVQNIDIFHFHGIFILERVMYQDMIFFFVQYNYL